MKSLMLGVAAIAFAFVASPSLAQDWTAAPTYGSVSLTTGFQPDPYHVNLQAGGSINARAALGEACRGDIANAPDFDLYFTGGSSLPLVISVTSQTDTTLVIRDPNGNWWCNDDGGFNGFNPAMQFDRPASGLYDIWVGTYHGGIAPATLAISELESY